MDYYKKKYSTGNLFYLVFLFISIFCFTNCSDSDNENNDEKNTNLEFMAYMPDSGIKGSELFIRGNNFGEDPAIVKVWVNEKEAEITKVSNTIIHAIIPSAAGSGAIKVMVGETEHSFPKLFTYKTTTGIVSNYAGNGMRESIDGTLSDASFAWPFCLAFDKKDDALFVLEDDGQRRLRRIKNGRVETVIQFDDNSVNNPRSIEFSITGDTLLIGNDNGGDWSKAAVAILKRSNDFKVAENLIMYPEAKTNHVNYCGINPVDGTIFYYCYENKLYKWDKENAKSELALDIKGTKIGNAPEPKIGNYCSFRFSPDGKTNYLISQDGYQGILNADYDLTNQTFTSDFSKFVGNGEWGWENGQGTAARLSRLEQSATDSEGNLYIADRWGHCIRKATPQGYISVYAGSMRSEEQGGGGYLDGDILDARFNQPRAVAFNNEGHMFVVDASCRVRVIVNE